MDLREKIIGVPPAGCAVLAYNYFDIDMGEAAH
jgi:2-oxoglutarate ferredoxin oxidoreductase subunit beta